MDEKTLTMEELKSTINEAVANSDLAKTVNSISEKVNKFDGEQTDPKEGEAQESAKFIKDLVMGKMAMEAKTISTDSGSLGYTVPTALAKSIHEKRDKISKIRANAFVFQLDGNFQLPVEGTAVTCYWVTTEADADITESNPTTTKVDLTDHFLASRVRIPVKLLNTSAVNVSEYVAKLSARAIASTEETAFVAGSGTDRPEGIRTASITTVAQADTALAFTDLVALYFAVPEQYRANAKWGMSTKALKLVMSLKDADNRPLYDINNGKLMGKEVLELTDIPENLGSPAVETEIYFGDFQEYWIKDGTQMLAQTNPVAGRLQVDLYVYESVDGSIVNTDAFRKLTGVK